MGIAKTFLCIRKSFIWYRTSRDVELFMKSCQMCNRSKKAKTKTKEGLGQYHVESPLGVHVDILGPFTPSTKGNQYVLMIVDQFTKWLECFPLLHQNAEETARCMVDGFISRLGCPVEIHTGQGKNFDGKLFETVCDLLQITKTRTTPYRPCSNGQVERYNRTLLQLIRCFLKSNQKSWDDDAWQRSHVASGPDVWFSQSRRNNFCGICYEATTNSSSSPYPCKGVLAVQTRKTEKGL